MGGRAVGGQPQGCEVKVAAHSGKGSGADAFLVGMDHVEAAVKESFSQPSIQVPPRNLCPRTAQGTSNPVQYLPCRCLRKELFPCSLMHAGVLLGTIRGPPSPCLPELQLRLRLSDGERSLLEAVAHVRDTYGEAECSVAKVTLPARSSRRPLAFVPGVSELSSALCSESQVHHNITAYQQSCVRSGAPRQPGAMRMVPGMPPVAASIGQLLDGGCCRGPCLLMGWTAGEARHVAAGSLSSLSRLPHCWVEETRWYRQQRKQCILSRVRLAGLLCSLSIHCPHPCRC